MVSTHTRREWLLGAAALPLIAGAEAGAETQDRKTMTQPAAAKSFPDKAAFGPMAGTYLDSGTQHPLSIGARQSLAGYLARRSLDPQSQYKLNEEGVLEKFARLVNADKDEVAYVPSTTAGEHLVLKGLGLPQAGAQVVTDTLHFFGSFYLYGELARQGVDVTWLRPVDGRVSAQAYEKAIRPGTKLVALSSVSTFNGFEHDVERICRIAHDRGALVYADIIHSAGSVPFDVKATGVDFAACASYKWLMGDFGLGFLYIRRGVWDQFKRSQWGYYALDRFQTHVYPFDPPGTAVADYGASASASGLVALGTHSHTGIALLDHSLDYLLAKGVANIQAHSRSLTDILKRELPRLGYSLLTPPESRAPIVACALQGARTKLATKLEAANVKITLSQNRFRVSTSVFNDEADIERLLKALAT